MGLIMGDAWTGIQQGATMDYADNGESKVKTFTAEEFSRSAAKVYRAVDLGGLVKINHAQYPDRIFILSMRERGQPSEYPTNSPSPENPDSE